MLRRLYALLLVGLALPWAPAMAAAAGGEAQEVRSVAGTQDEQGVVLDALKPLPRGCGGGLPPEDADAVCCMFGYVISDGQAVEGAYVRIFNQRTGGKVEQWTAAGPDSAAPYYRVSLTAPPLSAAPGDTLLIYTMYSSRDYQLAYTVRAGGQQVDLVIPHAEAGDYAFERRFLDQSPRGTFRMFRGDLAIDGSDVVFTTDTNNVRVQAFKGDGQLLAAWGEAGFAPGEMLNPIGVGVGRREGIVYVADQGRNAIHRFSLNGTWLGIWEGLLLVRDVTTDDAGNVYVARYDPARTITTPQILKLSQGGAVLDSWAPLGGGDGELDEPWGIWHHAGLLYVADLGNKRIAVFTTEGAFVRHIGVGALSSPVRVAIHPDGSVYVADEDAGSIFVYTPEGAALPARTIEAPTLPTGLSFDSAGNVYVADEGDNTIKAYSPAGAPLRQWGGTGGAELLVDQPNGAAFDASGNLYVVERDQERVLKFSPAGARLGAFTVSGLGGSLELGGVAVDQAGRVSVVVINGRRVVEFFPDRTPRGEWPTGGSASSRPVAIALDSASNAYIADAGDNQVRKFDAQRNLVWTVDGQGTPEGLLSGPSGVAVDVLGNVYVADTGGNRVQKFTSAGAPAGTWQSSGPGLPALSQPAGVAAGADGTIYVADRGNLRVVRYSAAGAPVARFGRADLNLSRGAIRALSYLAVAPDGRLALGQADTLLQTFRPTSYTRPVATIVSVTSTVTSGNALDLVGLGQASTTGAGALSYQWLLDGDPLPGATGPTATLSTAGLTPGRYQVGLRVQVGDEFDTRSVDIEVVAAEQGQAQRRSWTFLLYLAGDNPDIASALDEHTALGAIYRLRNDPTRPPNVSVVVLYDGPRPGGNDTVRWLLRPDGSEVRTDLGELAMDDPATLVEFVRWGRANAPADAYYLAIADHGNALDGIAWDRTTDPAGAARLTNTELRQALAEISDSGALPVDVLHLDACLMGLLESAAQVRGHARYLVVSQSLAWSAFDYAVYRDAVTAATSPRELALAIVERYAGRVRAAGLPYTISALDMGQLSAAVTSLDGLATSLTGYAQSGAAARARIAAARAQVQKLDSTGDQVLADDDEYVDLDHLAELLVSASSDSAVQARAAELRSALGTLVVANRQGSGRIGPTLVNLDKARGVGIYYPAQPDARLYQQYMGKLLFAAETGWDEFLQTQLTPLAGDVSALPPPNPVAPLALRKAVYLPVLNR